MISPAQTPEILLEQSRAMQSPLRMAEYFSGGQYKRARHLAVIDYEFRNLLEDPNVDILIVKCPVRHGKQCAHSTPVFTPSGWRTHGELEIGDKVYASSGKVATVIGLSPECPSDVEIEFNDGERIVCHENHEWFVSDRKKRKYVTVEAKEFFNGLTYGSDNGVPRIRYHVDYCGVLDGHNDPLPVDPYMLGVWLGDGNSVSWLLCKGENDLDEILVELEKRSIVPWRRFVHADTGVHYARFRGLPKLRSLGLLGNKHIPEKYLTANPQSRLDLLRGLIDTDGHVESCGRVRFVTVNLKLAEQVETLVRSFGWRASKSMQKASTSSSGIIGRHDVWTVQFVPDQQVALLKRKQIKKFGPGKRIGIKAVRRVEPQMGRCIEIDDPSHLYLVGTGMKPTHNSEYLSKWAVSWYMLRNPYKRVMICTNTQRLSKSHSIWVRDKVHELSPVMGLKGVDPNRSSATEWHLDGPGMGSCLAAGVGGSIVGFGADLMIIDDYLKDAKSAFSKTVRDAQWEWFQSTSSTRLEPGGKIVLLCTPWHEDDLIGRIMQNREKLDLRVRCITLQALREDDGITKDPLQRKEGEALWPERWPAEVMERRKKAVGHWWYSIYQGRPRGSGFSEWPSDYFSGIWADERDWPESWPLLSASYLDPSLGRDSKKGDYFALVYVGYANGLLWVDSHIDRKPVNMMVRDWVEFNRLRKPAITGSEANAFQELLAPDYVEACADVGWYDDEPILVYNSISKYLRIRRLGKYLHPRMLRFRRTASNELLVSQLKAFPDTGSHDDGPDALEGAIRLLLERIGGSEDEDEVIEEGI